MWQSEIFCDTSSYFTIVIFRLQFALSFEEPEIETDVNTGESSEAGAIEIEQPAIQTPDTSTIPLHYPIQAFPEEEYPFLPQEYLQYQQNHPLMGLADLAIHQQEASSESSSDAQNPTQEYITHPVMGLTDLVINQQETPVTPQFPQGHPLLDLTNLAVQTSHPSGVYPQQPLLHENPLSGQFQQSHPLTDLMDMAIQQQGTLTSQQSHPLMDLASLAIQHQGAPIQEVHPPVDSSIQTENQAFPEQHPFHHHQDQKVTLPSHFGHPLMDLTNMAIHQQTAPMSTQEGHPLIDLTHMAISNPQNDHFLPHQGSHHPQLGSPVVHQFQQSHPLMDLTALAIQPIQPSQEHAFADQTHHHQDAQGQFYHQEGLDMQGHPLLNLAQMAVQTTDHYPNVGHPQESFHPHGLPITPNVQQGHPLVHLADLAIQTSHSQNFPGQHHTLPLQSHPHTQLQSSLGHPFFGLIGQETPMMAPGLGYDGTNTRGGGIPAQMLFSHSPGFGGLYLAAR